MLRALAVCLVGGVFLAVAGCGASIDQGSDLPQEFAGKKSNAPAKTPPARKGNTQGGAGGGGQGNPFAGGQGQGQGGGQYGGGGTGAAFAGAGQGQQGASGQYGGGSGGGVDGAFASAGQAQQKGAGGQNGGGAAAGGTDAAFAGAGQGQQGGASGQYGGGGADAAFAGAGQGQQQGASGQYGGGGADAAFAGAGQGQQKSEGSYGGADQAAGNPFGQQRRRGKNKDEDKEPELTPDEAAERAVNKFLDALDHEEYAALEEVISPRAHHPMLRRLRGGKSDDAQEALQRLRDDYARGGRSVVLKVMPMPDKLERRVSIGIPSSSGKAGQADQASPLANVGVRQEGKAWRIVSIQPVAAG